MPHEHQTASVDCGYICRALHRPLPWLSALLLWSWSPYPVLSPADPVSVTMAAASARLLRAFSSGLPLCASPSAAVKWPGVGVLMGGVVMILTFLCGEPTCIKQVTVSHRAK